MSEAKRGKGKRGKGTAGDRDTDVHLTDAVEMLHEHITEALCAEVFGDVRDAEREKKWTMYALSRFWLAVIIEAPRSLSELLERTRKGEHEGFLPQVNASSEAFFQKCKNFSHVFFEQLHRRFIDNALPKMPQCYASEVGYLSKRFTDVVLVDGSRLDRIAHRLKILRNEKATVLPGCVLAVYDLFRGISRALWFDADAAASEFKRAEIALGCLAEGTLVVADRLYSAGPELFRVLGSNGCFGLFRRTKALPVREVKLLERTSSAVGEVEDILVECGKPNEAIQLRLIRVTKGKKIYEGLTNLLDQARLSAADIVALYPKRWNIERLFYDLKVVLNLKRFHAANPNAVAMQVYAAVMVHAAFRFAQGKVAADAEIPPEEISTQKLFPLLAYTSMRLIEGGWYFDKTCEANRKVVLRKPSYRDMPGTVVSLRYIRRQRRTGPRKKRDFDRKRATWKSLRKIKGSRKIT